MATAANMLLYDGEATAQLHTLYPVTNFREKGKITALYREAIATLPVEGQVSVAITMETLPSGVYKVECRLSVPVMESISGQNAAGYTALPKVAYVNTVLTTGLFSPRSTIQGRRNARWMSAMLLAGYENANPTLDTTGVLCDLFEQLIAPT